MINLTQKQFEKAAKTLAVAARLDELSRLEGYVASALISKRKGILKKQLASLTGQKQKEEENSVHIRIEIPETSQPVAKKEKSFSVNLKNLISGNFSSVDENDDDDDLFSVVKTFLPKPSRKPLGRIVREL